MDGPGGLGPTGPEHIGDLARKMVRGRLGRRMRRETKVLEIWEDAVGQEQAGQLHPVRLRSGVLWVEVESPAVLYETAQFKSDDILDKLRTLVPDLGIEELRFRLGGTGDR